MYNPMNPNGNYVLPQLTPNRLPLNSGYLQTGPLGYIQNPTLQHLNENARVLNNNYSSGDNTFFNSNYFGYPPK